MTTSTYWHGGQPGRKRGEFLLPPSITKAPSLSEYGAAGVHRMDRVYLTTRLSVALLFAAGIPNGIIYACEPIGDVEPDPDCTYRGISWQCQRARVKRVIKPKRRDIEMARSILMCD